MAKILVLGDVIKDSYFQVKESKLCPDAPCLAVTLKGCITEEGAAANVVRNLTTMGHDVTLITRPGEPAAKWRYMAGDTMLLRLDAREDAKDPIDIPGFEAALTGVDAVILSDYGKGTIGEWVYETSLFSEKSPPVYVDANRKHLDLYEFLTTVRLILFSKSDIPDSGVEHFIPRIEKHGPEGFVLYEKDKTGNFAPDNRAPRSVVGAGDALVSAIVHFQLKGVPLDQACRKANFVTGMALSHPRNVKIRHEDMIF